MSHSSSHYALSISSLSRVIEAGPCKAVVIPAAMGNDVGIQLRENDLSWKDFLSSVKHLPRYQISEVTAVMLILCMKYFIKLSLILLLPKSIFSCLLAN